MRSRAGIGGDHFPFGPRGSTVSVNRK